MKQATDGGSDAKTAEQGPSNEDVVDYLEAVFSADLAKKKAALSRTSPGSIAYAYAFHQLQVAQAQVDGGEDLGVAETVRETDGKFRVCEDGKSSDEACTTYGEVQATGDKIVSFTIDGKQINNRLSVGTGRKVKAGNLGTVELLSAYQTVSGAMFVTVAVQSAKDKIVVDASSAKYRSPSGRQAAASASTGLTDLDPDSTTNEAMSFPNADPGGVLSLTLNSEDYERTSEVKIKTR